MPDYRYVCEQCGVKLEVKKDIKDHTSTVKCYVPDCPGTMVHIWDTGKAPGWSFTGKMSYERN